MKTQNMILALSVLVSFSAQAKTEVKAAPKKAAVSKCSACEDNLKLAKDLQGLNFEKKDDHFKGEAIAIKTSGKLTDFQKLSAKAADREATFISLLALSREAIAFDGEGQIAQIMVDVLKDSNSKKAYDSFVKTMPKADKTADQCKSQTFEKSVAEQICLAEAGVVGQDTGGDKKKEDKATKCLSKFDYAACLKTAKK